MPYDSNLKQFTRENYPYVKSRCPADIKCISLNAYCQKFAKKHGFLTFESMLKEPSVPVNVDALNALDDELRSEGFDIKRTPMQMKWPQNFIFTSLESRALMNDHLKKVEHRVPYTHHARHYAPLMQPNGDGTWHIDVELIAETDRIINLDWFNKTLGEKNVCIVKGRNEYLVHLRKQADSGDLEAMHALAVRNMFREDYSEASELLERAVQLGKIDAHFELGTIYLYGLGVEPDPKIAIEHFKIAADNNNNLALNALGHMYGKEGPFEPDFELSFACHLRAAKAGNYDSIGTVGSMLYYGLGVTEDKEEALKYFAMGDEVSDGCSRNNIAYIKFTEALDNGDFVTAQAALEKAVEVKDIEALRNLGIFLMDGYAGETDRTRGYSLLDEAANMGDVEAMYRVGSYLFYGDPVEQDYEKAACWFHKAFAGGHGPAINKLAECFWEGLGVDADIDTANQLFKVAGEYREPRGYSNLSNSYRYGRGVTKNAHLAFEYMLLSAEGGFKKAMEEVAEYYLHGFGTDEDEEKSRHWSKVALSTPEFVPYQWVDPRVIDHLSPDYIEPIYKVKA